jgi:hypothetical protein
MEKSSLKLNLSRHANIIAEEMFQREQENHIHRFELVVLD